VLQSFEGGLTTATLRRTVFGICGLLKPSGKELVVLDPEQTTAGSGGFLLQVADYAEKKKGSSDP